MTFTPRFTAPSNDNLYYIKTTHGGYNRCVLIDGDTGSVLPNCTRLCLWEIHGGTKYPKL